LSAVCIKGICRKCNSFGYWSCKVNNTATYKKVFESVENSSFLLYSDMPKNTISERIHKFRLMQGYSRAEFAKVCSIGYSSVCKYEVGLVVSSRRNLVKIKEVFNLCIDYFHIKKEIQVTPFLLMYYLDFTS
jgi:predicted transcriptional regulator